MASMVLHPFSKSTGIEYLEGLHAVALELRNSYYDRIDPKIEKETSSFLLLSILLILDFLFCMSFSNAV